MANTAAKPKAAQSESKFFKEQLLSAVKFANRRDLLEALLDDGVSYSIVEVEKKISNYMGRKVD